MVVDSTSEQDNKCGDENSYLAKYRSSSKGFMLAKEEFLELARVVDTRREWNRKPGGFPWRRRGRFITRLVPIDKEYTIFYVTKYRGHTGARESFHVISMTALLRGCRAMKNTHARSPLQLASVGLHIFKHGHDFLRLGPN